MGFFGGGGGGASVVLHERVVLNDADIKALPTTAKSLVVLASGHVFNLISAAFTLDATAGAYTNIAVGIITKIQLNPDTQSALTTTDFESPLGLAIKTVMIPQPLDGVADLNNPLINEAVIVMVNGANGNLTGGNVANTLTVDLYYADVAP